MRFFALSALLSTSAMAGSSNFPSSDMLHAYCEIKTATIDKPCADVEAGLKTFVAKNQDPAQTLGNLHLERERRW